MFFYMSGTPRNDKFQAQENELCSHRLFSLHGDYQRAVHKWLDSVIELKSKPYPKFVMLDSGAFTAWNAGGEVTLDEVFESYSRFEEKSGNLFEEIWMINLDKIPGERGRTATLEEIDEAVKISDKNYSRLVERFGDRILPVYHQSEDRARLLEIGDMTKYVCLSPRNDLHEGERATWSLDVHNTLRKFHPDSMTHGLATTGNQMLLKVPWTSVDSAAWVLHAGFGKVDIFEGERYRNYFVSNDFRKAGLTNQHLGARTEIDENGDEQIVVAGRDDDSELLVSTNMSQSNRNRIFDTFESYGFDLEQIVTNSRVRSLVCMGELAKYYAWAAEQQRIRPKQGGLDLPW